MDEASDDIMIELIFVGQGAPVDRVYLPFPRHAQPQHPRRDVRPDRQHHATEPHAPSAVVCDLGRINGAELAPSSTNGREDGNRIMMAAKGRRRNGVGPERSLTVVAGLTFFVSAFQKQRDTKCCRWYSWLASADSWRGDDSQTGCVCIACNNKRTTRLRGSRNSQLAMEPQRGDFVKTR